jgi:hypothetical protein
MTEYHRPLEAGIIIGEQKANVKDRVRAARGGRMELQCPNCKSTDIQKVRNGNEAVWPPTVWLTIPLSMDRHTIVANHCIVNMVVT